MKYVGVTCRDISFGHQKIDNAPEDMNSNHCHDKYEIIYVREGRGKYIVEGIEYPLRSRTLMIFPPLAYHCVCVEPGSVYERTVLFFEKSAVVESAKSAFKLIDENSYPAGSFYSADAISDSIASLFDRLEIASGIPETERQTYLHLILAEIILLLSLANRENLNADDGELGMRVIRYLNENMDRDISLDMLAKKFFVSKYYLCRAFKKHNGISVHGYINQKRVMYAKQLIESGETASGAAYRVGFGDYSAFYRAYVKVVGAAPTSNDSRKENV